MKGVSHYAPSGRFACDVLIIDDYREFAESVAAALRRTGMTVQIALDAATARSIEIEPQVVLVDCGLPDGDGISLVRELGKHWQDATFLLLSGQVGGIPEAVAKDLRIRAFLNKPVPLSILRQAIAKLLREPKGAPRDGATHSWLTLGIGSPTGADGFPRSPEPSGELKRLAAINCPS